MNKRRLTFKRVFNAHTYNYSEPTITARFDSFGEGETNQLIIEPDERKTYMLPNGELTVKESVKHFLVGEITNRLYEYEELGYSPDELRAMIVRLKAYDIAQQAMDKAVSATFRAHGKTSMVTHEIYRQYTESDIAATKAILNARFGTDAKYGGIKDVIFNDPATIIFWKDGTKTIVKAEGEDFDPEKGLAMAISKKALGNQHEYYDVFKKWLKKFKPYNRTMVIEVDHSARRLAEQRLHNALHDKKATKADLLAAMQDAITYLNNEKEN